MLEVVAAATADEARVDHISLCRPLQYQIEIQLDAGHSIELIIPVTRSPFFALCDFDF